MPHLVPRPVVLLLRRGRHRKGGFAGEGRPFGPEPSQPRSVEGSRSCDAGTRRTRRVAADVGTDRPAVRTRLGRGLGRFRDRRSRSTRAAEPPGRAERRTLRAMTRWRRRSRSFASIAQDAPDARSTTPGCEIFPEAHLKVTLAGHKQRRGCRRWARSGGDQREAEVRSQAFDAAQRTSDAAGPACKAEPARRRLPA